MMLQATELGLGTVWVCYFNPDVLRQEFDLPANLEPVKSWLSATPMRSPLTSTALKKAHPDEPVGFLRNAVIEYPRSPCKTAQGLRFYLSEI